MRLACRRHLEDLERAKELSYPFVFDEAKAARVCRFIEQLPHTKGDWALSIGGRDNRIRLEPWQCFIYCVVFGWVHRDSGLRRFRIVYICVPRKNGKSLLAAGTGVYMFASDREFGAEVYAGATCQRQAMEVFRPAKQMVDRTPRLKELFGIHAGAKSMAILENGSRFEPIVGKPGDGSSPSCSLVDEYHEHRTDELVDAMRTGMGARKQPLLWIITTAGSNIAGPCHSLQRDVEKVLEGTLQREEVFGIIYTIDSDPYLEYFQSLQALQELERLCTCRRVTITQIEAWWDEAYAGLATTSGTGTQARSAAISILTGQSGPGECAERAMSNGCSTPIPNEKNDPFKGAKNGPPGTKTGSKPLMLDGVPSQRANKVSSTEVVLSDPAYRGNNTTSYGHSKTENAPFVSDPSKPYARIEAIAAKQFGDCSARNATPDLLFSEILKKVYNAHSTTCEVRSKASIEGDRLAVQRPPDDWTSELALRKANPNYGISVFEDFLRTEQAAAIQNSRKQNIFKTKHLNIWCGANVAWMNAQKWKAVGDGTLSIEQFAGEPVWIGCDLASSVDIAASGLVFRRLIDGKNHYYVFGRYYLPRERAEDPDFQHYQQWLHDGRLIGIDGPTIDLSIVRKDLLADAEQFDLQQIGFDPWSAMETQQELSRALGEEKIISVPQRVQYLSYPMKQLEALVLEKRIHHDGCPVLAWMMSNVVAHADANENIFPRKEKPENKIDGVVALIIALSRAMAGEAGSQFHDYNGF